MWTTAQTTDEAEVNTRILKMSSSSFNICLHGSLIPSPSLIPLPNKEYLKVQYLPSMSSSMPHSAGPGGTFLLATGVTVLPAAAGRSMATCSSQPTTDREAVHLEPDWFLSFQAEPKDKLKIFCIRLCSLVPPGSRYSLGHIEESPICTLVMQLPSL